MRIQIIAVGHLKEKYLKEGIAEYAKRLSRYCDLEIIEVEDEKLPEPMTAGQESQAKQKEAQRIRAKIKPGSLVVALDVKGQMVSSEKLSLSLENWMVSGRSAVTFVLGGSVGFDPDFLHSVDMRLSMSPMTFPHQLARLMLVEQIYRCFKILKNETYHK